MTMDFNEYLDGLRARAEDAHRDQLVKLDHLNQRMFENDCDIARKLEEIAEGQARRACGIQELAVTIASRYGKLPSQDQISHHIVGNPRAGLPQPKPPPLGPTPVDRISDVLRSIDEDVERSQWAARNIFDVLNERSEAAE